MHLLFHLLTALQCPATLQVAEEVENGLQKYKADIAEVNRKTELGHEETDGLLNNTQVELSSLSGANLSVATPLLASEIYRNRHDFPLYNDIP